MLLIIVASVLLAVGVTTCACCIAAGREDEQANRGCWNCKHYLGGGLCRQNLEKECGDGGNEAWQAKSN